MQGAKAKSAIFPKRQRKSLLGILQRYYYKLYLAINPPIDISDEYINWLYNANAGILVPGNLYCMDFAIRNLPSQAPILEIGSFCGLSTNIISYFKGKHGVTNPFFTCEPWAFEEAEEGATIGASDITQAEYREFARQTFIRNTRMFSRKALPFTVEMYSDDFFQAWSEHREVEHVHGGRVQLGGRLSFCYIDGNHAYDQVRRDFEHCNAHLEAGGFILFDDSADGWGWEGVRRVVAEVRRQGGYELVIKNPNYLFQKK